MKQSDPLELVDHGSLVRPGPVGRLVRFALGVVCLYALWDIVQYAEIMITQPFSSLDNLVLLIVGPLCVFNYVVNIGFSKSWGKGVARSAQCEPLLRLLGWDTPGRWYAQRAE